MSVFAVVHLNPTNPEMLAKYREVSGEALAKHGGRVAVAARNPAKLEGPMEAPKTLVLLEFPSAQAAHDWHNDPDLRDIHALRTGGADVSIFVMDPQS